MSFIQLINESVDPFLMQLVVVPIIVIGCGVSVSVVTKKITVAPAITLALNILYERYFLGLDEFDFALNSWNVTFTVTSLIISLTIIKSLKADLNKK